MSRSAREWVPCRLRPATTRSGAPHERFSARDRHRAVRPQLSRSERLLPLRQRRLARRQPRPAGVRRRGARSTRSTSATRSCCTGCSRQAAEPARRAGTARPDGGRLLRRGDGRGSDRRGRRGAARRRYLERIDAVAVASPTSATLDARPAAHRRGRLPLARHRPGLRGRRRLPRLRRARAGWGCRSATTTSATTSARSRCARRTSRTSPTSWSTSGRDDAERARGRRADPRLRDAARRGVLHRRADARRPAHDEPPRRRLARRAHARLRPVRPTSCGSASPPPPSTSTTPASSRRSTPALAETPLETLRDYLRWHLVRTFASSLCARVRERGVRLLRQDARRAEGAAGRGGSACSTRRPPTSASWSRSSTSRRPSPSTRSSAARRWSTTCSRRWATRSATPSG